MAAIVDLPTRQQFVSTSAQSVFTPTMQITLATDVLVYVTPTGDAPEDSTQLKTLNSDYTITSIVGAGGFTVTFTTSSYPSGLSTGDIVSVVRLTAIARATQFSDTQVSNADLNTGFNSRTLIEQQNRDQSSRSAKYPDCAVIGSADALLPQLGAGQIWKMSDAGTGINAVTPLSSDSTLRSELAVKTLPATGATLVGYNDGTNQYTLQAFLDTFIAPVSNPYHQNLLINGNFNIWQRGTTITTPNDDVYSADQWIVVSDGNGVVTLSQETSFLPAGSSTALKVTHVTANKQWGLVNVLESANSAAAIETAMSMAAQIAGGAQRSDNVRMAIIEWTGTADSITSDVVATWNGDGTNPTLATNWAYVSSPADIAVGASYVQSSIVNVAPSSSMTNLAVFIWLDDTDASANDLTYIGEVFLHIGAKLGLYTPRLIGEELALCQRYYQHVTAGSYLGTLQATDGTTLLGGVIFSAPMRVAPAYGESPSTALVPHDAAGAALTNTGRVFDDITTSSARLTLSVSTASFTAGDASYLTVDDPAYIAWSAEL